MNKKGDVSLNYIIIAVIALIVLVIAILFFSGAADKIIEQLRGTASGVPDQIKAGWRSQCEIRCPADCKSNTYGTYTVDEAHYDSLKFTYEEDVFTCGKAGTTNLGLSFDDTCGCKKNQASSVLKKLGEDCESGSECESKVCTDKKCVSP